MAQAWVVVERAVTAVGQLELRRRGARDVLLTLNGRVLMNSRASRSEVALAQLACAGLPPSASVLIGGLGLGLTLRAALHALPSRARVQVAELDPIVVRWCREHLVDVHEDAFADPRVRVRVEDVALAVGRFSQAGGRRFDAILFDLYEGPSPQSLRGDHPLYGPSMLQRTHAALHPGGRFAVWSEQPCPGFEKRLRTAGFDAELHRPGRGGLRHAVYLARRKP